MDNSKTIVLCENKISKNKCNEETKKKERVITTTLNWNKCMNTIISYDISSQLLFLNKIHDAEICNNNNNIKYNIPFYTELKFLRSQIKKK